MRHHHGTNKQWLDSKPIVLVIGDLILDEYLCGHASRLTDDHAAPILNSPVLCQAPGGAANVAVNAMCMGATQVHLLGVIGNDRLGVDLTTLLSRQGVSTEGVLVAPNKPTTQKTRVIAQGRQMLVRIDREDTSSITRDTETRAIELLKHYMKQVSGVICSDYGKGFLTERVLRTLMEQANAANVPVTVDPKGEDCLIYIGAQLITPNVSELSKLAKCRAKGDSDVEGSARTILNQSKVDAVVVTCGIDGAKVFEATGQCSEVKALLSPHNLEIDPNGAGDTFIAALSLAFFAGSLSIHECVCMGNVAASIAVRHQGTHAVTRKAIIQELQKMRAPTLSLLMFEDKIISLENFLMRHDIVSTWPTKVVFTNGCFDLLHAGHLELLERAKALGDILVVGMNADVSVRRLKGSNRPVLPQEQRARALAAMKCVDFVIIFDDDTPAALIDAIKPGILVKGGDYLGSEIVGQRFVEGYGGQVKFFPFLNGCSSTRIIQHVLDTQSPITTS